MKLVAALTGCLLTACAGRAAAGCLTRCGLSAPDLLECRELQQVEDSAMWAFKKADDPRLKTCGALKHFRVQQMDAGVWQDDDRRVAGLTWCNYYLIQIGNVPLRKSSLVHEIAHALQHCTPKGPLDPKDPDHSNWADAGIYEAIEAAKRYDGGL